jgi:hypothetical protein
MLNFFLFSILYLHSRTISVLSTSFLYAFHLFYSPSKQNWSQSFTKAMKVTFNIVLFTMLCFYFDFPSSYSNLQVQSSLLYLQEFTLNSSSRMWVPWFCALPNMLCSLCPYTEIILYTSSVCAIVYRGILVFSVFTHLFYIYFFSWGLPEWLYVRNS